MKVEIESKQANTVEEQIEAKEEKQDVIGPKKKKNE